MIYFVTEVDRVTAVAFGYRGKSGLRRARCLLTGGGSDPMESATENIPPAFVGKGEMVR